MFAALSNPNRLRIYLRLLECCTADADCDVDGSACVGELGRDAGIAPSTVSHHIKELRDAGLIRMERRGRRVACSVDGAALERVNAVLTV
jgi:ArsR family transcriptional regulator